MGGKPFSKMDREELNDAVDKSKALPDMVLKRIFFNAQEQMTLAEAVLMENYYRNGGFYDENKVIHFRSTILTVFRLISGMINENKINTWVAKESPLIFKINGVKSDYELCLKLTNYAPLSVSSLIHLAGYLNYCLHELGLTNLLMSSGDVEFEVKDLI